MLEYEFYVGPLRYQYTKSFDENAYDIVEIGYALIRWFADPLVRYLDYSVLYNRQHVYFELRGSDYPVWNYY